MKGPVGTRPFGGVLGARTDKRYCRVEGSKPSISADTIIGKIKASVSINHVMGVRTVLTRLLLTGGPEVIAECRHCGTTVDPGTDRCPECGTPEISRYEIPD